LRSSTNAVRSSEPTTALEQTVLCQITRLVAEGLYSQRSCHSPNISPYPQGLTLHTSRMPEWKDHSKEAERHQSKKRHRGGNLELPSPPRGPTARSSLHLYLLDTSPAIGNSCTSPGYLHSALSTEHMRASDSKEKGLPVRLGKACYKYSSSGCLGP